MTSYRLYVLNRHDGIAESIEDQFADDGLDLAQAEAVRRNRFAVEVWTGQRLVGRIGAEYSVAWPQLLP